MSIPRLFFGAEASGAVLAAGVGETDAGAVFTCRARSRHATPAGAHGQCLFTAATLTLNHRRAAEGVEVAQVVAVTLRALVDDVEVCATTFNVSQAPDDAENPPERVRPQYRVPLSVPFMLNGVEAMRQPPRGSLFQIVVEWPGGGVGVDSAAIHYSVLRDNRAPAG